MPQASCLHRCSTRSAYASRSPPRMRTWPEICWSARKPSASGRPRSAMKVLIANRGEIAVRVIRACREMGLATVAVFSECDRGAPHVRLADEAHLIGPSPARESYLRIDRIVDVARRAEAALV